MEREGDLARAQHENRLERTLQQLGYPKVLIVDEIGYLPLSPEDPSLFFRLVPAATSAAV